MCSKNEMLDIFLEKNFIFMVGVEVAGTDVI
jgi:hypothetical protein